MTAVDGVQVGVGSLNHETGGAVLEVRVQGANQCFDTRALAIIDEAIAMGVLANLPVFRSTEAQLSIDLRSMPAAVAEVRVAHHCGSQAVDHISDPICLVLLSLL